MKRSILNTANPIHLLKRVTVLLKCAVVLPVLFCLLYLSQTVHATSANYNITLAYTQDNDFSQQLINYLVTDFQGGIFNVQKTQLQRPINTAELQNQNLVIAIGSQATQLLLDADTRKPILSLLISENISRALEKTYADKQNWSSLLIDQPVERQFSFITHLIGEHKKIGILLSPITIEKYAELKQAAAEAKHQLISRQVNIPEELLPELKSLSKESDLLFTSLDPTIYNKTTIRGILLSSYRYKLPIIGFSKAYVKAGAIAAIYSSAEQISAQAVHLTKEFFQNNSFDKTHYYPDDFSILLNHNVARSLGLSLPDDSAVAEQIKLSEKKL